MRWCNTFARSLLFALLAALAYPVYRVVVGAGLGEALAFASYAALAGALYLFAIARRPTHGLGAAVALLVGCLGLVVLGATAREIALASAVGIGVFRSGLLYRGAGGFSRRLAIEAGVLGSGLVLAGLLSPVAAFPGAWVFWGFFLAQSGFFLIGGDAARSRAGADESASPDAFAEACARAREVLERRTPGIH